MTCRWGPHDSDPAGGPVRLSGYGSSGSASPARKRTPRGRLRCRPVVRVAEPLGRPRALRRYAALGARYMYNPPLPLSFAFSQIFILTPNWMIQISGKRKR